MIKKILCSITSVFVLLSLCIPVHAQENTSFAQNAQGAYVMEYTTNKVVFTKNETKRMYPASMTKMMSLLLVYEAINNKQLSYQDTIQASAYAASMGGSQIFLKENEEMTVEQLLKSVCIASANDAMVALAEKVAGSESAFVEKMNAKAKVLKLSNTHFMNTTGLHHDEHYSCPKDMAIIAKALLDVGGNPLLKITSTYEDYIREDSKEKFWLVNTNKLIRQYEGVDGLKTGYTSQAKSCITVTAKRNNMRFIVVVMGEPDTKVRNEEVKQLLDYSFSLYDQILLYKKGEKIEVREVAESKQEKTTLVCEDDISIIFEKGKEVAIQAKEIVWLNKELPYKKGERVAKLLLELSDGSHITTYLVNQEAIDPLSFLDRFAKALAYSI